MPDAICQNCGRGAYFIPLFGKGTVEWVHSLGTGLCDDGQTIAPGPWLEDLDDDAKSATC